MNQCPYFKNTEGTGTKRLRCLHSCIEDSGDQKLTCNRELFNCAIRPNEDDFNSYLCSEVNGKRADLIYNDRDLQGALQTESDSWLAFEMMRRFGQRQAWARFKSANALIRLFGP